MDHSTKMTAEETTIALVQQKIYLDHQWYPVWIWRWRIFTWVGKMDTPRIPALSISGIVDLGRSTGLKKTKQWPLKKNMLVEEKKVILEVLIDRGKIILPPLHTNLGLIKQFVKALKKEDGYFDYHLLKNFSAKHRKPKDRYFWWTINQETDERPTFPRFSEQYWGSWMVFIHSGWKEFSG